MKSLIPFSEASPILPFSIYFNPFASIVDCARATATSPVVLMCACHFFERWVYAAVNEAVETSVIRPDNPDAISPETESKHRITTILGLRGPSPPLVRKAINRLLVTLGWAIPYDTNVVDTPLMPESVQQIDVTEGQTIDVAGTTVSNVAPLQLAVAQAPSHIDTDAVDMEVVAVQGPENVEVERPSSPMTPSPAELPYDDDDPRIRITSREGIVEMEVRLPPRILSSRTEVVDALPSQSRDRAQSRFQAPTPSSRPQHRVTELSLESSRMVSAIVKAQLTGLAILPIKLMVLRSVASHFLASHGDINVSRAAIPLLDLEDLSWRSVVVQASRLALCNMLEIAIDLALWSIQHAITLHIGKSRFGWRSL